MPRRSRPSTQRLFLAALALLVAGAIPFAADAKLYKLVDKNGKVSYGDKVPKGFDGEVTEIAIDAPPPPAANPPPSVPRASSVAQEQAPKRDINTERKVARAKFQGALDAAREKLAAAKKALADGGEIAEDEFQVIQQRIPAQKDVPAPRSNCFQQPGAMVWICPVQTPGEKYRDRQKSLEDAVSAAEAELTAAEDAYRRGTD